MAESDGLDEPAAVAAGAERSAGEIEAADAQIAVHAHAEHGEERIVQRALADAERGSEFLRVHRAPEIGVEPRLRVQDEPQPLPARPASSGRRAQDGGDRRAPGLDERSRHGSPAEAVLPNGQVVLLSGASGVAARRPDRLITTVGSDLGNFAVAYDGTGVTVFEPIANVYARTPVTGPLADAVARIEDELGLAMPVRPLLAADPFALPMTPTATAGVIVGRSFIGDTPVDHLAFRNAEADWEIWLEATPHALPRRASFVRRVDDRPIRITLTFDEWALGATLPDAVFAFTPPAGAVAATPAPPEHRQGAPRR